MKKWAYYNEKDPFAAAWIRELMKRNLIAKGEVDERSIVDVRPEDVRDFCQCHYFAGVAVWSYALRQAGWPDDRPVWTGSCPCQPFSSAGKGKGFKDERHLWPEFYRLISQCRPTVCFGEQVASKDGLAWLDLVQADMEGTDYAFGAVDTCAAGFGAPHIRQRMYWVADADNTGRQLLAHAEPARICRETPTEGEQVQQLGSDSPSVCGLAYAESAGLSHGRNRNVLPIIGCNCGENCWVANSYSPGLQPWERDDQVERYWNTVAAKSFPNRQRHPSPTNGFWRDADWLLCRDGKWRAVEPSFKQMADGIALGMGYLCNSSHAIEKEEVINEAATDSYTREVLRKMREANCPEAVWLQIGRQIGFYEATLLLTCVLKYAGKLGDFINCIAQGSAEEGKRILRNMWKEWPTTSPSQRFESGEQSPDKLTNTLRKLPQEDSLEILKTLNGSPLACKSPARVGRLRGYGNAINAEQAKAFIEAFMEVNR